MKPRGPWRLPWSGAHVPHALLDIIRGCNITCEACYNTLAPRIKSLAEVEAELTALQRRRHLSSVSIIGGETLLHPQLCDIIRLVKARRLGVEVFTNGVLLDDAIATKLKAAGADAIFLHIERAQQRPDLPANATTAELRACWAAKTQLVARHGMDAGLTLTTCAERPAEVDEIIRFVVESDATQYLLVTLRRDLPNGLRIGGDVDAGLTATLAPGNATPSAVGLDIARLRQQLARNFGLEPFAYLGSSVDANDPRWLSYLVVTARQRAGTVAFQHLHSSAFERTFIWLMRWLTGRFPMYRRQTSREVFTQLLLNTLAGGGLRHGGKFLRQHVRPGARYRAKRLLFQQLATVDANWHVMHCLHCPDAVMQNGRLLPVCLLDKNTSGAF